MADIFLATRDGRTYAVKRILPHLSQIPEVVEMFLGEAELAGALDHPRIARVLEAGEAGGAYYLVLEHVDGKDLQSVLEARPKPVPAGVAAGIVAAVADGLDHAHERGLVHRDISTSNIMISFRGEVKLLDFGIAAARKNTAEDGALKGKYAYMAPEQVKGLPLDRRADLFSLGIVAHELLTGRRLFQRDNQLATLHAVTEDPIPAVRQIVPDVPEALDGIVGRLLLRDRDDRLGHAGDLRQELLAVLADLKYDEARVERHVARFLAHVFPRPEVREEPPTPPPIAALAPVPAPARPARGVSPLVITAVLAAIALVTWLLAT